MTAPELPLAAAADAPAAEAESFANVDEVVAYLRGQGWAASRANVYRHVGGPNGLRKAEDGTFRKSAVDTYARRRLKRQDGTTAITARGDRVALQKAEAEVRKLTAEAARQELRLGVEQGKLLPRDQVEEQQAAAFQLLKNQFETWSHEAADQLVETFKIDPERAPEVLRFLIDSTEDYFARFADDVEWTVEIEEEPEGG